MNRYEDLTNEQLLSEVAKQVADRARWTVFYDYDPKTQHMNIEPCAMIDRDLALVIQERFSNDTLIFTEEAPPNTRIESPATALDILVDVLKDNS